MARTCASCGLDTAADDDVTVVDDDVTVFVVVVVSADDLVRGLTEGGDALMVFRAVTAFDDDDVRGDATACDDVVTTRDEAGDEDVTVFVLEADTGLEAEHTNEHKIFTSR